MAASVLVPDVLMTDEHPAPAPPSAALHGPTTPRGWRAAVLAVLALVFVGMGVAQARADSLTFDEAPDLAGGLVAVVGHDAGVTPEHGLLPRVLAVPPPCPPSRSSPSGATTGTGSRTPMP